MSFNKGVTNIKKRKDATSFIPASSQCNHTHNAFFYFSLSQLWVSACNSLLSLSGNFLILLTPTELQKIHTMLFHIQFLCRLTACFYLCINSKVPPQNLPFNVSLSLIRKDPGPFPGARSCLSASFRVMSLKNHLKSISKS